MRAAVYYGKENIQVKDWPAPQPGEGDVIVRVRFTGICGTDMAIYAGKHPRVVAPLVPGHEIVGRIEVLGSNTDCPSPVGARVVIYASFLAGIVARAQKATLMFASTWDWLALIATVASRNSSE